MEEKKEVSKFIENFLREKDLKLEIISNLTGVSLSAVGHYKTGERTPKDDFINKFIEVFKLNDEEKEKLKMAVALDRTPEMIKRKLTSIPNVKVLDEQFIKIPIKAKASAGNGYLNFEEDVRNVMIRKNGFDANCYLIEVVGDSMAPLIYDGSYIVVDPREMEIINNKIYVIEYNGEIFLKKVIKNEEIKAIILKSVNPKYDDIIITGEDVNHVNIKGRAVKFILEGKL